MSAPNRDTSVLSALRHFHELVRSGAPNVEQETAWATYERALERHLTFTTQEVMISVARANLFSLESARTLDLS